MTGHILSNKEANANYPVIHSEKLEIINVESDGSFRVNKTPTLLQKCEICDKATLLRCNKCRRMAYCCKEHQKLDWNRHKGDECACYKRKNQKYLDCKLNALKQIKDIAGPTDSILETIDPCFYYVFGEEADKSDLPYTVKNKNYKSKLKNFPGGNN